MGNDRPVIEFRDLSFAYERGKDILSDVNFTIHKGDSATVIGPNGGGKSTILKLMLGLIEPYKGSVRVLGEKPSRSYRKIGYMPQHNNPDPRFPMNVMDIVLSGRLGIKRIGFYNDRDREAAVNALREMELLELKYRHFADLSGGQRQRVFIARALATEPEILLLDEPVSNADPSVESHFLNILKKLSGRITTITVSHDLGFVSEAVNRVLCVNKEVRIHPTSEITGEIISEVYGNDMLMIRHDHCCKESEEHSD